MTTPIDATIVGSGPNGLAAAVVLARAGLRVHVYEAADTIGGGSRTKELTLPGFHHDVCSAVHPLAFASGFFRRFGLADRIPFVVPDASYAHPLDGGVAGIAWRDLDRTATGLGGDGRAWSRLLAPLVERADAVAQFAFSPLVGVPARPEITALVGLRTFEQGTPLGGLRFRGDTAPAMLAGAEAHACQPIPGLASAGAGLFLALTAHARGWPIPLGGSQAIADTLAADLLAHGGRIHLSTTITNLAELPRSTVTLLDVSPRDLAAIGGSRLPDAYRRRLLSFRYGVAAAKVDFALDAPVPWTNPEVHSAGTVHLGGVASAIAHGEREVRRGRHSADPYVLVSQPSLFDESRAPATKHTLWAYTHVPPRSDVDQTEAITAQIERFAPGFRDTILATSSMTATELDRYNPNYVGGDIAGGATDLAQLIRRPILSPTPWRTPAKGIYLCSSAVAPGPGVHGLVGAYAARTALRDHFGVTELPSLAPARHTIATTDTGGEEPLPRILGSDG